MVLGEGKVGHGEGFLGFFSRRLCEDLLDSVLG